MIAYGYVALRQFPKSERHVLAQELRSTMWCMLRLIIIANHRYHKKTTMQDLDAEIDVLRSQIRLAMELQFLDFLGYRIYPTHMALRKSSGLRMQRGLKKLAELYRAGKCDVSRVRASIQSWLGHCSHCRSYAVRRRVLGSVVLTVGKEAQA